jgi:diguanylate cyclase (GGDEF)-like protein
MVYIIFLRVLVFTVQRIEPIQFIGDYMNCRKRYTRLMEPWPPVGIDPATGLPNLLSLVTEVPGLIQCSKGCIIAVSIPGGDCLNGCLRPQHENEQDIRSAEATARLFGQLLYETVFSLNLDNTRIFRTGVSEFFVLVQGHQDISKVFIPEMTRHIEKCGIEPLHKTLACTWAVAHYENGFPDLASLLVHLWTGLKKHKHPDSPDSYDNPAEIARHLITEIQSTCAVLKKTRELAYTDDITQLPNHRSARYVIEVYFQKSLENNTPLSLLFVDGDNLKQYNDNLGYTSGNTMIHRLGATLASRVSQDVLVSRWFSGDEFMIVVPECPKNAAIAIAKDIRRFVQETAKSWIYPVTVTIGVATYPDDASAIDCLIKKVEEANEKAKRKGKNQVYAAR